MPVNSYKIGRVPRTGPFVHAFNIEWNDKVGAAEIKDEDPENGPNDAEKRQVQSHFQAPVTALTGGEDKNGLMYDGAITLQPGTVEHFATAVYQIPKPFGRMPS